MESEPTCKVCGRLERVMKRCTRCRRVFYCSRSCQLRDWVTHKYSCVRQTEGETKKSDLPSEDESSDKQAQYRHDGTIFTDESEMTSSTKPGYRPTVDFGKALTKEKKLEQRQTDAPVDSTADNGGSGSRMYLNDNIYMGDTPTADISQPHDKIVVKGNRDKQTIVIQKTWSGEEILKVIASEVKVPLNKLKVIHKGKVMTSENIRSAVRPKALFQVIGERAESEDGLDKRDIDIMMAQLHVDRNEAILALRKKGDVIDALLHAGSK
ncbi:uncharacterized protein LOC117329848 [Pecten maximus]|uniref:uncharacterized protein LOC117329848 n=1 Tax=Pecten maximus TaxID=6579 RepID=UPI0014582C99|nr:uncharacterized protein LOC117329848 [Pecten maximus]